VLLLVLYALELRLLVLVLVLLALVLCLLRTFDLPGAHQTDICMTCRLWVLLVCLNGVAASPQNYTHPKVVAVRDVVDKD
jgi:hypothetical protein